MEAALPIAAVVLMAVIFLSLSVDGHKKNVERRLKRMEHKVDLILEHLGIEEAQDPALREVDALWHQGKKVQAIKRYREITGDGLAEAKEAVERRTGGAL